MILSAAFALLGLNILVIGLPAERSATEMSASSDFFEHPLGPLQALSCFRQAQSRSS